MPFRTRSQKTGDAGQNFVRECVDNHPSWMCRAQDLDFGVDLEAELAPGEAGGQRPSGKLVKLQIKSSESIEARGGRIPISLDRAFLDYVQQFRLPVILVAVATGSKEAWWLWLQEWLLENETRLAAAPRTDSVVVHIPEVQTLAEGLGKEWIEIAGGREPVAIVLALRDLVAVSASGLQNVDLFEGAVSLLDKIEAPNRTWSAEKVIDLLVGLGPNIGFWQTSQLAEQLIIAVEHLGHAFSKDQVLRMVCRGEAYSRTGMYGLARLYDRWPEHARELNLPVAFQAAEMDDVAWYCAAREHYSELNSMQLWQAFAARRLPNTRFGNIDLAADDGLAGRLYQKWPNRGDSALLDNLVWVGDAGEASA